MGTRLVGKLVSQLENMELPEKEYATSWGSQTYEMGLEQVDEYQDDPATLLKALKTFRAGDSIPYVLAGVSYTLIAASREPNGTYSPRGIQSALEWLERAQEYEPYRTDINFTEALAYIYSNRLNEARMVLDFLQKQSPHYYHLQVTEGVFWRSKGDLDKMIKWYSQASTLADTTPRKVGLHNRIADAYFSAKRWDEAIKHYQKAIYFNKRNGQLWHQIGIAYAKTGNSEESRRCKLLARKFGYTPAVQKARFTDKLNPSRLFGRVISR